MTNTSSTRARVSIPRPTHVVDGIIAHSVQAKEADKQGQTVDAVRSVLKHVQGDERTGVRVWRQSPCDSLVNGQLAVQGACTKA